MASPKKIVANLPRNPLLKFQKFDWIFRYTSLFLTIPMSQKSKSSGKTSKAAKPAKTKAATKSKPKAAEINHKTSSKTTKAKASESNGHAEEQEPQRPLVRMPRDAKTLAFLKQQKG